MGPRRGWALAEAAKRASAGMRHRPRGPFGPSHGVKGSRGVGRRTTHILVLEPFGFPAVRSGASLSGLALAPRVRIAPERSAFYRPKASALVGGRVSPFRTWRRSSFWPSRVRRVRPSPDPLPALTAAPP